MRQRSMLLGDCFVIIRLGIIPLRLRLRMIQLGFASAILPDLSLTEVFELAADIGYECVEVMCWPLSNASRRYAGITHIDIASLNAQKKSEIDQLIQRTGVQISALGYYPNCLSADKCEAEKSVVHLKHLLRAAVDLGLDQVNTFIGRDHTKSVDENWSRMLATWNPIVALAEELQIKIGIENCPMSFTADEWPGGKNLATSPAIWSRLFEDIPSKHLGLNYDPSHMVWQHMNYLQPIREFIDRIHHTHAKDVRIDQHRLDRVGIMAHPMEYHAPKLPGLGEINWGQFFSTLREEGYDGAVCVEVEDRSYEGSLENRIASLRQSYRYLRNFT